MSLQIKVINNLPQNENAKMKIEITYGKLRDDVIITKTFTSNYIELTANEFTIDTGKNMQNIRHINVYMICGVMAYVYKFITPQNSVCITISSGHQNPIVRINNHQVYRRDETCLCNPCLLCCCCSITALLDDIEQSEHDANSDCSIS